MQFNAAEFWTIFQHSDLIGTDQSDDYKVAFYRNHRNAVGEVRYHRRTTITTYQILSGETKEMVIYWYTVKPQEDRNKEAAAILQNINKGLERLQQIRPLADLSEIRNALSTL